MKKSVDYIHELRDRHMSCSQATLLGIAKAYPGGMPDENVLKSVAATLRGGIGRTFDEGTCGALTGAAIAIGLHFADDENKACNETKKLFNDFKNTFGTVMCGRITDANGKKLCNSCCQRAAEIVNQIFNED